MPSQLITAGNNLAITCPTQPGAPGTFASKHSVGPDHHAAVPVRVGGRTAHDQTRSVACNVEPAQKARLRHP